MAMEISNNYYSYIRGSNTQQSKATTASTTLNVNECSAQEKFDVFKAEIWDEINKMPWNKNVNASVQITDGAFKRMMEEPEFKNKMLSMIREESIAARSPVSTSLTCIDEKGYSGYSYNFGYGEDIFKAHSNDKNSFYTKKAAKNDNYDNTKRWEEMNFERRLLERRIQANKLQKEEFEKERQMAETQESIQLKRVIAEYENNIYSVSDL